MWLNRHETVKPDKKKEADMSDEFHILNFSDLTVQERVSRGIAFLDEKEPGWRNRINKDKFNVISTYDCTAAQATGLSFFDAIDKFGITLEQAATYGFCNSLYYTSYQQLTDEWLRQLS